MYHADKTGMLKQDPVKSSPYCGNKDISEKRELVMFKERLFRFGYMLGERDMWYRLFHCKTGIVLSSVILGCTASLGFAPYNLWVITLLSLGFEFYFAGTLKSGRQVFISLWLYFTALNAVTLWWLNFVMTGFGELPYVFSVLIEVLFSAYLAFFHALAGAAAYKLSFRKKNKKENPAKKTEESESGDDSEEEEAYAEDLPVPGHMTAAAATAAKIAERKEGPVFCKYVFMLFFLPVALTAADFLIGILFTGFPWMYIGYTINQGPFTAYAPLIGVRGITLVMFICAGSFAMTVERRYEFLPVAGVLFALGIFLQGIRYTDDYKEISLAGVQGNTEQSVKWDPRNTMPVIHDYINTGLPLFGRYDLVIWPESALPAYAEQIPNTMHDLNDAAFRSGTVLITGIQRYTVNSDRERAEEGRKYKTYNSLFVLGNKKDYEEGVQIYDKRQLVPFGENIPFEEYTRNLGKLFNFPMSGFTAGEENQNPLHIKLYDRSSEFCETGSQGYGVKGEISLLPAICYESIFPELILSMHNAAVNAILTVSNDSWFGDSRGPDEHAAIAAMRSMELQKPTVRITNSGHTQIIDAFGRVTDSIEQNRKSVLIADVMTAKGNTPFARFGNIPLAVISVLMLVIGFIQRNRQEDRVKETLKTLIRP